MLDWYEHNPKDGFKVARAIKVGIRIDKNEELECDNDTNFGRIVPEADREVYATSDALCMAQQVVKGDRIDGEPEVKYDLS